MPSIRDLYPFYLTADHLQNRSVVVHISSVTVEELWNSKSKRKEPKLVVRFHNKKLALACNKTQATQLERLTGSDDYTHWIGHTITLSPTKAPSGTNTIAILPAPPQSPAAATSKPEETQQALSEEH
jgi:hypothetical protein